MKKNLKFFAPFFMEKQRGLFHHVSLSSCCGRDRLWPRGDDRVDDSDDSSSDLSLSCSFLSSEQSDLESDQSSSGTIKPY